MRTRGTAAASLLAALLTAAASGGVADAAGGGAAGSTAGSAAGSSSPGGAAPVSSASADLPALQAELARVTQRAQRLARQLERSRARDGGLRQQVQDLAQAQDDAQAALDARVRAAYIAAGPRRFAGWSELTAPGSAELARRGSGAALDVGQDLVAAVGQRSATARAVQAEAARLRARLGESVQQVLAAQDRARDLLVAAEQLAAQQAAELAAQQAREQLAAEQQAQARARELQLRRLAAARAALDEVSAQVTRSVAPVVTERGTRASTAQAPLLELLVQAGSGYPTGYRPSGQVLQGTASWYGPGFVGSPTASGAPYDPEQLTCAHKQLPFGTVLHVSANGRSVNCLVTDRGPYVGDRMLDLSRAGSRALGYDGTAEVVAEVLTAVG